MDYTIKWNLIDTAMRVSIDSAVHGAVSRFSDELGEKEELAHDIARIAAETAVEHFKTLCNAELRMIQVEHERQMEMVMVRPTWHSGQNAT